MRKDADERAPEPAFETVARSAGFPGQEKIVGASGPATGGSVCRVPLDRRSGESHLSKV